MTNAEKYKTANERLTAHYKMCENNKCNCSGVALCVLRWLEQEAEEEKPLPCPFCGSEACIISGTKDHYIVCRNDDCAAALIARSFSSAEEAIAAWNRRAK